MLNKDYFHCQKVIAKIKERLRNTDSSFSVFGSSVYGKKDGQDVKPDVNSDIDSNLIINKKVPLYNLEKIVNPIDVKILEMFYRKEIDILALRGNYEKRPVIFQCMNKQTYQRLLSPDETQIIMYKERKNKLRHPKETYFFETYSLDEKRDDYTRIIPLEEGNLIYYNNTNFPFSNQHFYLTLQQRQILTQKEVLDEENYLKIGKLSLINELKKRFPKENLISFFKYQVSLWSDEFKREMEEKLK